MSALKARPKTPPKKDFRSTLKPRQGPSTTSSKPELEFQNVFGKLKRAQAEKFTPPDELKSNILRGKAGLATTGGPQKTERRDELKDSLLKQKAAIKEKVAEEGSVAGRKPEAEDPETPEALARRKHLARNDSISDVQNTPSKTEKTTPEAIRRQKSIKEIREKPKAMPDTQPTPSVTSKAPARASKLADRFNPALVGMLARGPSPHSGNSAGVRSPSPEKPVGTAPSAELTHMTKGRARGPKRRAPAKSAETPEQEPEPKPKPAVKNRIPSVSLVRQKDILPSSPAEMTRSEGPTSPEIAPSRRVSGSPFNAQGKPKLATPIKSPSLKDIAGITPQSVQEDLIPQPLTFTKPSAKLAETTPSRPLPEPPLKSITSPPSFKPTQTASSQPEAREVSPERKPVSVRGVASLWGRQDAAASPTPVRARSPIKLPTRDDEQAAMEDAGLVRESEPSRKKPGLFGLGLGSFAASSPSQVSEEPTPSTNLPLSPPLSAGLPPKVAPKPVGTSSRVSSVSFKAPPESPIPQTSEAGQLFADFFDDRPVTTTALEVDTQAILAANPLDTGKIKTLRKHIHEINCDGKMFGLPPGEEHILYEDAMYLCNHVFGDSRGARVTETYLWAGTSVAESAVADAQIFARRTAKDNGGRLVNIRQGKETPSFFQALDGIIITRFGSRSDPKRPYMLCGRRHLGHIAFDEVDLVLSNLCSGFPFIISSPAGHLYLWKGRGSNTEELSCAKLIGMDLGDITEIEEGSEPASFIDIFPAPVNPAAKKVVPRSADHWKLKAKCDKYNVRLFKMEQVPATKRGSGGFQVSSLLGSVSVPAFVSRRPSWQEFVHTMGVQSPTSNTSQTPDSPNRPSTPRTVSSPGKDDASTTKVNVVEIAAFCQGDLEAECVYVLDAFFEIYIIVGPLSQSQSQAFSTALLFAQEYGILAASIEDRPFVPVSTVVLEGVPRDMKAVFRSWQDRLAATSALMAGKIRRGKSLRVVGLAAAIAATRE